MSFLLYVRYNCKRKRNAKSYSRYNKEQRIRIKKYIKEHLPGTFTSEPGIDYPYGDEGVKKDLKLNLK